MLRELFCGKWVKNNINGFLVPLKSPEHLAAKIVYLLQSEDKRRQFEFKKAVTYRKFFQGLDHLAPER